MSGYNEAAVMEKLGKLNESQESIQTLAQWIMYHRKYAAQSVKIWADMIQKGEERRRHSCLKKKKSKLLGSVEKWLRQFCFHQDREATVFCWDLSLDLTFLFLLFMFVSFLFSFFFPFFFSFSFSLAVTTHKKLQFLYVANDIVQHNRKKDGEFVREFATVFPDTVSHVFRFVFPFDFCFFFLS